MKVYKEFVKRVVPTLGKSELRLCMILLDICNKSECIVDKVDVYKHPLFTNTLKQRFNKVIKTISGKIIHGKYKTESGETHVLFNKIELGIFTISVKMNDFLFNYFRRNGYNEIPAILFEKFNHVYETKFFMWFKTWEKEKEQKITVDALKTFLNKQYRTGDFISMCIKPVLQKMLIYGIEIEMIKILNENDKRYLDSLCFKLVE